MPEMNRKGQIGAGLLAALILVGISAFIIVTLWSNTGLNCTQGVPYNAVAASIQCTTTGNGLFNVVSGTFLPILALGIVGAVLIKLFG